jgi:hypothetical protein
VHGGRHLGAVSHIVTASRVCVVQNTLSGHVQLPLLEDWSVGLSWGRAILISRSASSSIIHCAVSCTSGGVHRWVLRASSHRWW